jgi:hypothetical protein
VVKRNNVFLIVAGVVLLLAGAGGGVILGTFALRIADVIWQTVIGIVGLVLIVVGIFLTWREGRSDKPDRSSKNISPNEINDRSPKGLGPLEEGSDKNNSTVTIHPEINWPPNELSAESFVIGAKSTLLLLGTSLKRLIDPDILDIYHNWLNDDPCRRIGLLFLNPHSPHASGRSRRSSSIAITLSLEQAYLEYKDHERFIPAIYEGPYRYSARAADLRQHGATDEPMIKLVTSTHSRGGTSWGFEVSLSPKTNAGAYQHFETELLDVWETALANPPGHGISMVYRSDPELNPRIVEAATENFIKGLGKVRLYSPEQYHLTITSICRTQSQPFLPPLRIDNTDLDQYLPLHFGDFLQELIHFTSEIFTRETSLVFDHLKLDESGQIRLESDSKLPGTFVDSVERFHKIQRNLVIRYSNMYPDEIWTSKTRRDSRNRFYPRYDEYAAHITVGVAFEHTHGLPTQLKKQKHSEPLPKPVEFVFGDLFVVHYAYRSLLRCIGELTVPLAKPASSETILRKLGIDTQF